MLSKESTPPPIVVPSPSGHQNEVLPLPSATPGGRSSSRGDLLADDYNVPSSTKKTTGEVKTLRMLFGGSICLLLLCISMLIVVSVVPLRNAAVPLNMTKHQTNDRRHHNGSRGGGPRRLNPFHLTNGPLEAFGAIDGMVLDKMTSSDGTPVERYYRIQRVTRMPSVYQATSASTESKQSVRVEFFGGDFMIADHMSAALFRRRAVEDEVSELPCAPLRQLDNTDQDAVDTNTTTTLPASTPTTVSSPSSIYCAVALLINPEAEKVSNTEEEGSSSNHTRGLQGRTAIYFPYRDGINYPSAYGNYVFNTGSIYGNDGSWSFWGYPSPRGYYFGGND